MKDKLAKARKRIDAADRKMANLFEKRMRAVEDVAVYKMENKISVLDTARENEVIGKNAALVNEEYKADYVDFLTNTISISKKRQHKLIKKAIAEKQSVTVLEMNLSESSYPIYVGNHLLENAEKYFDLNRRVFIVTDSGVPSEYAHCIRNLSKHATVMTVEAGEGSKSFATLENLIGAMSDFGLNRGDCVVAVGGGVVGDLAGFAASIYMRGVDFYNVPTTLLAQVDSSIGGKNAINLKGIKNSVGTFAQPKAVIIDTEALKTLPIRHMRNGMCEVIKMAATSNSELFARLEKLGEASVYNHIEEIIIESLKIKKSVVEADEKENGIRRILNFGHTLGHAIESHENLGDLLHGECVAIGMMATSSDEAKDRIKALLEKFSLRTSYSGDIEELLPYIMHDKKSENERISAVYCCEIGKCYIRPVDAKELRYNISECINCQS